MVLQEQIDSSKWRSLEGLDVAHMLERWASLEPDKALMVWEPGLPGASQIAD